MVAADFPRKITQPVVGLTLWAVAALASPSASVAQLQIGEGYSPVQPSAPAVQPSEAYILGGGDTIRVDVFGLPDYSGNYQIPTDGVLNLPLAGSVSVQGLTLTEASDAIAAKYVRVLKRPTIAVNLQAARPLNVLIAGEVNRPGSYAVPLKSGVGQNPGLQYPTVSQAIETAGGITLAADIRQIQVRRRQRAGLEQVIDVNFWEMLQGGDRPQDITLRDGDSIFVPTASNANLAETRQLATASFAQNIADPRTVTVVGEVARPGSYAVLGGTTTTDKAAGLPTVTRALQLAGGIKPLANVRRIQLRRPTRAGAEQIINLDLWQLLQTGDVNQDTLLQDGDTIVVPTATEVNPAEATELAAASFSPATIEVTVVGEVKSPGRIKVPANTPLNQALLAAGGFDPGRANKNVVELISLNPDGTVSRRGVAVDLAQAINDQTNPTLSNNDVIIVNRSGITTFGDTVNNAFALGDRTNSFLRILDFLGILQYIRLRDRAN